MTTRDHFEIVLKERGFRITIEDDPAGGASMAMIYKFCGEPDCPANAQTHFTCLDDFYIPSVLTLLLSKIVEGDCTH